MKLNKKYSIIFLVVVLFGASFFHLTVVVDKSKIVFVEPTNNGEEATLKSDERIEKDMDVEKKPAIKVSKTTYTERDLFWINKARETDKLRMSLRSGDEFKNYSDGSKFLELRGEDQWFKISKITGSGMLKVFLNGKQTVYHKPHNGQGGGVWWKVWIEINEPVRGKEYYRTGELYAEVEHGETTYERHHLYKHSEIAKRIDHIKIYSKNGTLLRETNNTQHTYGLGPEYDIVYVDIPRYYKPCATILEDSFDAEYFYLDKLSGHLSENGKVGYSYSRPICSSYVNHLYTEPVCQTNDKCFYYSRLYKTEQKTLHQKVQPKNDQASIEGFIGLTNTEKISKLLRLRSEGVTHFTNYTNGSKFLELNNETYTEVLNANERNNRLEISLEGKQTVYHKEYNGVGGGVWWEVWFENDEPVKGREYYRTGELYAEVEHGKATYKKYFSDNDFITYIREDSSRIYSKDGTLLEEIFDKPHIYGLGPEYEIVQPELNFNILECQIVPNYYFTFGYRYINKLLGFKGGNVLGSNCSGYIVSVYTEPICESNDKCFYYQEDYR